MLAGGKGPEGWERIITEAETYDVYLIFLVSQTDG
jgi:hypothetical protein